MAEPAREDPRRAVPRTDGLLADPRLVARAAQLGPDRVKATVRDAQDDVRAGLLAPNAVVEAVLERLPDRPSSLQSVLNATGVVLHTNLGRAALSQRAVEAVVAAAGATDVELDLRTGRRARRGERVLETLRTAVPDAGDVHVVNNGAAALLLAATVLAGDAREIVVSRGELVEIGDGFRLPDLIESTGARLRPVGTTNRTTYADYATALAPRTAFVLKVHPSNFHVSGFTSDVSVGELARLPVPLVVDIGSGLLAPDPVLPNEPDAASVLRAGAALVTASGDKLLGGPQAGLLMGQRDLVARLRRHPLARALRVDKLTLAALEASLPPGSTPTAAALHADREQLRQRAEALVARLREAGHHDVQAPERGAEAPQVVKSLGVVGGGGAPGVVLPGWAVALPERLSPALRLGRPPVLGRVERGRLLLDLRCVPPDRDDDLLRAIAAATHDPTDAEQGDSGGSQTGR